MGNLLAFLSFRKSSNFHLKYLELFLTVLLYSILDRLVFSRLIFLPHIYFEILIIENFYFKQYDLLVQSIQSLWRISCLFLRIFFNDFYKRMSQGLSRWLCLATKVILRSMSVSLQVDKDLLANCELVYLLSLCQGIFKIFCKISNFQISVYNFTFCFQRPSVSSWKGSGFSLMLFGSAHCRAYPCYLPSSHT